MVTLVQRSAKENLTALNYAILSKENDGFNIKTAAQHKQALLEIEKYFTHPPVAGSLEEAAFDRLFNAIEAYEAVHFPIGEDEEKLAEAAKLQKTIFI